MLQMSRIRMYLGFGVGGSFKGRGWLDCRDLVRKANNTNYEAFLLGVREGVCVYIYMHMYVCMV